MNDVRTTRPTAGNKYFIRQANGGYSTCIKGKPTDSQCNVLSNCVGYACGAYNEQENLGYEKYHLNCNAENFIERAIASGLSVVKTPVKGGIMVWQKGNLASSDGAGHVAIALEDGGHRYAQSGYGSSTPFWITTTNNNNGRYGLSSAYTYRGCIVPKNWKPSSTSSNNNQDNSNGYTGKFKVGDKVIINGALYVSSKALSPNGSVSNKETTITRVAKNTAHPYNTTGDLGWMNEADIKIVSTSTPSKPPISTPIPAELKVGDKVKIIAKGNGSSYGDSNTAYGIGWKREILKIWSGRAFPYQVGNSTGTTGFYKASALQKII